MAEKTVIRSILVANRGEIAVRIIRAARDMGIKSIAIYSDADEGTLHTRLADERIALGGSSAKDTYLNIDKILLAAIQSGADAIHPGYGFLSENSEFARRVEDEGLTFIGPPSRVIGMMGDKINAREAAMKGSGA
jgi:acetyl-CoA/propionyl-CoA carboxylase, biotin carboxylase, biotin carboxyl carrier protein